MYVTFYLLHTPNDEKDSQEHMYGAPAMSFWFRSYLRDVLFSAVALLFRCPM